MPEEIQCCPSMFSLAPVSSWVQIHWLLLSWLVLRNVPYANLPHILIFNLVSLYISVVCNHGTLQPMVLPYRGKLSREKTFAYLWLFRGVVSFDTGKTKVFSMKVILFTNLRKFPPSKVSLYTVLYYWILSYVCTFLSVWFLYFI